MILQIILGAFLLVFIVFLLLMLKNPKSPNRKSYPVVKAGDATKDCVIKAFASDFKNKKFIFNNEIVDSSDYSIFIVKGESMSNYDIHDGDAVFVQNLSISEKYTISDDAIIVLEIDKVNCGACVAVDEYKLRKFICYLKYNENLDDVAQKYPYLFGYLEKLKDKLVRCKEQLSNINQDCEKSVFTLSETKYSNNEVGYSIHSIANVRGSVKFIVPSTEFKRFEN